MKSDFEISRRRFLLSLPAAAMAPRLLAQAGTAPIRVKGINHVTLHVSDLKRSLDFYQGLFGAAIINRQGTTSVALQIGNGPQHMGISVADSAGPRIDHLCLAVDNFNVDRLKSTLMQHGVTDVRVRMRGPEDGGAKEGTPEFYFRDPGGLSIQLQDPTYCGGAGALGNVCPAPQPSPKKGLMALKNWSHCTNTVSDSARANKFYQEVFGFKIQAYQGPTAPVMGLNAGVQFLMFAGAAGRQTGINHCCMSVDNFDPDKVIKILESYGIKPRENSQGTPGPLVHYISMRMENRGGAKEGTPELYFTDPDGLVIQLQDTKYCGGAGRLGEVCL
jgi:catechol 2,3-dioxygenase-like lactoylglutathione lyase family enzyme